MNKKIGCIFLGLTLIMLVVAHSPAEATDVHGSIDADTTWTTAGSPYVVTGNLYISEGVTLTINPNVEVSVEGNLQISVNGTLDADTVTFTWAVVDNEWDGIQFNNSGADDSHLNHCILEHAKGTGYDDVIHLYGSSPTITGCFIKNSSADDGIGCQGSSPVITGNTIDGFSRYGVDAGGTNSSPTVTGNTLTNNGYGVRIYYTSNNPVVSGNTYSGNTNGDLSVLGGISADVNWNEIAGTVYRIPASDLSIQSGGSLTIGSGIIVKLDSGARIGVNGTLNADTVTFTWAVVDNEWDGIQFNNSGADDSHLNHCILEHAKGTGYDDVIHLYGSSPTITGCTINYSSADDGIGCQGSSPVITGNTIDGFSRYGVDAGGANSSPTVTGNTLTNNGYGVRIYYHSSMNNPIVNGNTYSGNTNGDLSVLGGISADVNWNEIAGTVYRIPASDLNVGTEGSLIIGSGIIVKLDSGARIGVNGGPLNADTVTFTWAVVDNEWDGIQFNNSGADDSHLNHCILEHAKGTGYDDVIHLFGSSPTITDCTIHNSSALDGIGCQGSSPEISHNIITGFSGSGISVTGALSLPVIFDNTITVNDIGIRSSSNVGFYRGNTISGNTSYGIFNTLTTATMPVDAEYNYWGDNTGPYDPSDDTSSGGWFNPSGFGDQVSNKVDYDPWVGEDYDVDGDGSRISGKLIFS